jgi:hypothetical protein
MYHSLSLRNSRSHISKVPKCEIFDRSGFPDFYTIKSLWEGDFVVKIFFFIFRGAKSAVPSKHAEHTHQERMRTLRTRIRFLRVYSA